MSLLMQVAHMATTITQVRSVLYHFQNLKIFVQDLGVCQLWVRENWGGVETSCTPSLTSSILTLWPDTRGHRVKIPGEEVKVVSFLLTFQFSLDTPC